MDASNNKRLPCNMIIAKFLSDPIFIRPLSEWTSAVVNSDRSGSLNSSGMKG